MPYAPPVDRVRLISRHRLDRALRERDMSVTECARVADTSKQAVSRLRLGHRSMIDRRVARAIERALRVERGHLFTDPDPNEDPRDDENDENDENDDESEDA